MVVRSCITSVSETPLILSYEGKSKMGFDFGVVIIR